MVPIEKSPVCLCLKCLFEDLLPTEIVARIFYSVPVVLENHQRRGLSALLRGADFGFQLDELLRHLVGGPLGQDPHHRHARLVGVNARPQRTPAHAALALGDVSQLDHGHAHHPVGPAEAVVLHRRLELVAVWGLLPQDAAGQRKRFTNGHGVSAQIHRNSTHNWKASLNLADQLLFLDFVVNLRFLSARKGPIRQTSTKGRNMPEVCHFMSFTAMTGGGTSGYLEQRRDIVVAVRYRCANPSRPIPPPQKKASHL